MEPVESERREQILDAAERLFRHYGPGKTTMAEIAREARVGVGSVYLEFAGKEAILVELSRRRHGAVLAAMRAAGREGAPSERLLRVLRARAEAFLRSADDGAHALELLACRGCASVRAVHDGFRAEERAIVAEILAAGAATGELAVGDAEALAGTVLQAFVLFTAPWVHGLDRAALPAELERLHRLVVHGLARRG